MHISLIFLGVGLQHWKVDAHIFSNGAIGNFNGLSLRKTVARGWYHIFNGSAPIEEFGTKPY